MRCIKGSLFLKINIFLFFVMYVFYDLLYDIDYQYAYWKLKVIDCNNCGKTTVLLSSISVEFIINLTEFCFFFPKIMDWNIPELASKAFILNHVNRSLYHALGSLRYSISLLHRHKWYYHQQNCKSQFSQ